MNQVLAMFAMNPVAAPAEAFGVPSVSFEQASGEAVAGLQAGQNPET